MQEMQAFGFNAFHRAICPGLAEYEHSFPERLKHDASFPTLRGRVAAGPASGPPPQPQMHAAASAAAPSAAAQFRLLTANLPLPAA